MFFDDCPQAWSRLWLSHVYYWWLSSGPEAWSRLWLSHVYFWWLSSGLISTMIESCLLLMIVLRPSGMITTMIESCLLLMIVLRPDHDYDWVMFIFDVCPQAWSRLWLSHVYYWWLSSGLITTMNVLCLSLMIVLRLDHDYDWVVSDGIMFIIDDYPQAWSRLWFIIDDCPHAWSRLWLSCVRWDHVYFLWLSSGLITTMIESCLFLMIALRPDHNYDWVVSYEIMFIIDDCPRLVTTMIESCLLLMFVLRPVHDYD